MKPTEHHWTHLKQGGQIMNETAQSFLRLPQVLQLYPVSRSTWWAGVRTGRFPKAVKLSPRTSAWRRSDIEILINQQANQGK